jgi:hypothetical protein
MLLQVIRDQYNLFRGHEVRWVSRTLDAASPMAEHRPPGGRPKDGRAVDSLAGSPGEAGYGGMGD